MSDSSPLLHPTPRREFMIPTSAESSASNTPSRQRSFTTNLEPETSESPSTSRNRSILNLTASTLFGIYSPSGYDSVRGEPSTPFGTGAETPLRQPDSSALITAIDAFSRPAWQKVIIPQHSTSCYNGLSGLILRSMLLFFFGVAYGLIITHLHDNQQLAPVKIEHFDRNSWRYLVMWGIAGVVLGGIMPWVDIFWKEALEGNELNPPSKLEPEAPTSPISAIKGDEERVSGFGSGSGTDWSPVVRSMGAFIGIAFAIRKLPWQSTLQVSLTLALVNPLLWYLVDRSKPGIFLSTIVGITGTAVWVWVNPQIVPTPAAPSPQANASHSTFNNLTQHGFLNNDTIGVWTWIASVLFCSSVCFGNIGRRLALAQPGKNVYQH